MRTAHAMGPLSKSLVCRAGLLLEPNGRAAWAAPCHSTQFWRGWELCFSISRLMHSSSRAGAEQSTPEGDTEGAARQKKQEAAVEDAIRDSLRRLYKMVHPDLFSDHATAKVRGVSAGCPCCMRETVRDTASTCKGCIKQAAGEPVGTHRVASETMCDAAEGVAQGSGSMTRSGSDRSQPHSAKCWDVLARNCLVKGSSLSLQLFLHVFACMLPTAVLTLTVGVRIAGRKRALVQAAAGGLQITGGSSSMSPSMFNQCLGLKDMATP